jgi:hypothetical protein
MGDFRNHPSISGWTDENYENLGVVEEQLLILR